MYDASFRIASASNGIGQTTSYYVARVANENSARSFTRNALGDVSSLVFNDRALVTESRTPSGATTRNAYDGLDRLTATTNPEGGVVQYAYDLRSNIISHNPDRAPWNTRGERSNHTRVCAERRPQCVHLR